MSRSGDPVTADDLGVGGAMCVLMKDALMPTIMQVCGNNAVLLTLFKISELSHFCIYFIVLCI